MKSYAIGVVVAGVAAWYGTQDAQAQGINITVTGPTAVYTDSSSLLFTGTVTGYDDYLFRLWVYLNGTMKKDSGTLCYSGSDASYLINNANLWGMQAGDELRIRVRVWITSTIYSMKDTYLTVQQGSYYGFHAGDAPEQKPAGAAETLHAAVIRSDEQELLA